MFHGVRKFGRRCVALSREVVRDTRGAVAVYIVLATMFLLPAIAISIDMTTTYNLHTETEQAAQAAALAAAKELDFTDDGVAAATVAARQAVTNIQTNATDDLGDDIEIETIQFLRALPPAGEKNYEDYITNDADEIRFVRTITEVRARESATMRAYKKIWQGADDDTASDEATKLTIGAAIAGRTAVACRTLPLMTCNPVEYAPGVDNPIIDDYPNPGGPGAPPGAPGFDFFSDFLKTYPEWTRRQLRMKFIGPDTGYANGVFGLVEPHFTENHGAKGIEDELALGTPTSCIVLDKVQAGEVDVKTGQAQTIVDGINVRFDMLQGNWKSEKNNPKYPPGPNNIKGRLPKGPGKVCTPDPAEPGDFSQKLPQDECFIAETAAELEAFNPKCYALGTQDGDILTPGNNKGFAGRYGNGRYDIVKYFEVNHPGKVIVDPITGDKSLAPAVWAALVAKEAAMLAANGMSQAVAEPLVPPLMPGSLGVPPARAAIYEWEYETGLIPGVTTNGGGPTPEEEGLPQCSNVAPVGTERRDLWFAIVNCIEHEDDLNSGQRIVKVQEFMEAFSTEPADHDGKGGSGDKGAIYIEAKRAVKPGSVNNVVLRDLIQLY